MPADAARSRHPNEKLALIESGFRIHSPLVRLCAMSSPYVPGLTRPVSVSEYATLTGASEAAVLASVRALKAANSSLSLTRARNVLHAFSSESGGNEKKRSHFGLYTGSPELSLTLTNRS